MPITTGMNAAMAEANCDMVYDATDDLGMSVKCFMRIDAEYQDPDRSVGFRGGWAVSAKLIGCQIGLLVLGEDHADHALDGNVAYLEKCAADCERDRLDAEEAA